jgi:hypothetical protein
MLIHKAEDILLGAPYERWYLRSGSFMNNLYEHIMNAVFV